MSDPIEANAVFDGFHSYDYQSYGENNAIGQNYHQFRLVGGDVAGAPIPTNLDMVPFLQYLKRRYDQPDLWLGKVTIGAQLYDHTQGSVTFNSTPTFVPVQVSAVASLRMVALALLCAALMATALYAAVSKARLAGRS
jgi:hypothetical protein